MENTRRTKISAEGEIVIRKFYKHLLQVRKKGKYELADIANLDETGPSLKNDNGKT